MIPRRSIACGEEEPTLVRKRVAGSALHRRPSAQKTDAHNSVVRLPPKQAHSLSLRVLGFWCDCSGLCNPCFLCRGGSGYSPSRRRETDVRKADLWTKCFWTSPAGDDYGHSQNE